MRLKQVEVILKKAFDEPKYMGTDIHSSGKYFQTSVTVLLTDSKIVYIRSDDKNVRMQFYDAAANEKYVIVNSPVFLEDGELAINYYATFFKNWKYWQLS